MADHLGSTTHELNSAGNPTFSTRYYPYGNVRSGFLLSDKRFTGHQLEGSLYYMKARFYDPVIGRFLQPDTIVPDPANPQSLNRYSYVLNNPLRYTDPTGQSPYDNLFENINICLLGLGCAAPFPNILEHRLDLPRDPAGDTDFGCEELGTCVAGLDARCWRCIGQGLADVAIEFSFVSAGCGLLTGDTHCLFPGGQDLSNAGRGLSALEFLPGGRLTKLTRVSRFADEAAAASRVARIHGNSADSPVTAHLYRLTDSRTGEYLKTGVSSNPFARYSKAFMQNKEIEILQSGSRRDMLKLERLIVERNPGPLNHESWAGLRIDGIPEGP